MSECQVKYSHFDPDRLHVNEKGATQSYTPCRFDLIPSVALFKVAEVLGEAVEKYGLGKFKGRVISGNWNNIPVEDHLNHALQHIYGQLSGDRTEEHLSHAICRLMFALELLKDRNG